MDIRFLPLGDSALTLELDDCIDRDTAAAVAALDQHLLREQAAGSLPGIIETLPTYRSLTVTFDPMVLPLTTLKEKLQALINTETDTLKPDSRCWRLPVCYNEEYGPDLAAVAAAKGLSQKEVIDLHANRAYTVYMIGFLPGFPYMGDLDPTLQMPRLSVPRVRVPLGSVAITGLQTAIYPWESPGGWHLLGCCPLPLFDSKLAQPALLSQGDQVKFEPVSVKQFHQLKAGVEDNSLDISQFLLKENGL